MNPVLVTNESQYSNEKSVFLTFLIVCALNEQKKVINPCKHCFSGQHNDILKCIYF